ncbi:MAG: NADP-reducing hydrogenase subunit HndA [Firmicutes bacterium ADurb.Bin248]|mgnify:CR=1 FL=1|jgi:NADH:ubiquinone oxidoreductase subunit E|nr:MAG: NADP-reducing hydrogenase subunit HndA [Firmicutes bacterium ADurb.Bin248]HOF99530.1 NADH-quinone oxidoreductase subunit NuoE [Clostridia bacterium]HPK15195.1 NADH-quinone oxidoreductase subunit NuoE [Clostridia bacterium]
MAIANSIRKEQFDRLDGVIAEWKDVPGGLLPIMQHAQEICGCVNEQVQHYVSEKTGTPVSVIYGVATFYSQFTLQPRGKHTIGLCLGTACYVRGSQLVLEELEKQLGIAVGTTTPDGLFTLEATRCIGCCGLAPAMMINEEVYGRLTPEQIPAIVEKYRKIG